MADSAAQAPALRIACLLPSATEIVGALGLGRNIVALTHECDRCPDAAMLEALLASTAIPRVTSTAINPHAMAQAEIDDAVKRSVASGLSLYAVDRHQLLAAEPTLVITQALCAVCAAATDEVDAVCADITKQLEADGASTNSIRVLSLQPSDLPTVADSLETVADACGVPERGVALRHEFETRLRSVGEIVRRTATGSPPTVLLLEWLDPVFDAGHWVPGQIAAAGCMVARLGSIRIKSTERDWSAVIAADPDCVLVGCCGFDAGRNQSDVLALLAAGGEAAQALRSLRAFQTGNMWAVDANTYFARPAPSLAAGAALTARCAYADQPAVVSALESLDWLPPQGAAIRLQTPQLEAHSASVCAAEAAVGRQTQQPRPVEIEDCWTVHAAAVAAGEQSYDDPETGYFVFSEVAHKQRGACCGNGCRHCPYAHVNVKDKPVKIQQPAWMYRPCEDEHTSSGGDGEGFDHAADGQARAVSFLDVVWFRGDAASVATLQRVVSHRHEDTDMTSGVVSQQKMVLLTCFDAMTRQLVANGNDAEGGADSNGKHIRTVVQQAQELDVALVGVPLHKGLTVRNYLLVLWYHHHYHVAQVWTSVACLLRFE